MLVDTAPKPFRAVKAQARRAGVNVTILADIVHVLEYVWAAARGLFGRANAKAEKWVGRRRSPPRAPHQGQPWRRRKDDALVASRTKKLDAAGDAANDKACAYLADRTRTRLLRYQDALRDGLPIATGVIEGACRYVVRDRMDRTGARSGR